MDTSTRDSLAPTRQNRRATAAIVVALVAMALKLPQAILALWLGEQSPVWIPSGGVTAIEIVLGLGWMIFSAALLWLRRWVGVISSLWFCVVSGFSGTKLILDGYQAWGWWQVLTAATAAVAVVLAVVFGAVKGSRW